MTIVDPKQLAAFMQNCTEDALNDMLDQRDSPEFEQHWAIVFNSVNPVDCSPETEQVFLAVSEATEHHEIASYVADDIDLIYTASHKNYSSDFLTWLQNTYAAGQFPYSYPSG